jgi:hypothetical protein
VWREGVVAYLKALTQQLAGKIEENKYKPQSV